MTRYKGWQGDGLGTWTSPCGSYTMQRMGKKSYRVLLSNGVGLCWGPTKAYCVKRAGRHRAGVAP